MVMQFSITDRKEEEENLGAMGMKHLLWLLTLFPLLHVGSKTIFLVDSGEWTGGFFCQHWLMGCHEPILKAKATHKNE